jgi:hypothetical protein
MIQNLLSLFISLDFDNTVMWVKELVGFCGGLKVFSSIEV